MKKAVVGCLDGAAVLGQDSFDRANGPLGNAEVGGVWVAVEGTMAVSSNKAKATVVSKSSASINVGTANCVASVEIAWYAGETVALVMRGTSGNDDNQMRAMYNGSDITITRRIAGAMTALATYSYAWTSGATHKIKMSCIGNAFVCYLDDVQILTATNDNVTKTQTYVGILASKTTTPASTFDNLFVEE